MRRCSSLALALLAAAATAPALAQGPTLIVTAANEADLARPNETLEVAATAIRAALREQDLRKIHVRDERLGKEILVQAIDMDGDRQADLLVFQADLAAKETRRFTLSVGDIQVPKADQYRVYGRLSRERFDDFLWENDRVAHRMYGKALETRADEPLTSTTVDVWCKRTRRLVINDWLMVDDYHADHGEGADFYSAGKSRGCGGSALWENGQMFAGRNFVESRVLAAGPIRLVFELVYEPVALATRRVVAEVKRVTLDAGANFNRFESFYRRGMPTDGDIDFAVGIKKGVGSTVSTDVAAGTIRTWEPVGKDNGNLGCAVIFDPSRVVTTPEPKGDYLVVLKAPADGHAVYHVGSGWDRSGDFPDAQAWDAAVAAQVKRLQTPVKVVVVTPR